MHQNELRNGRSWVMRNNVTVNIIGRFAVSTAGKDAGIVYVIVAEDDMYLYLSDGKFHPPDNPKRKNRKHIQLMHEMVPELLLNRLHSKERIFDHEIKYAIKSIDRKEEKHV